MFLGNSSNFCSMKKVGKWMGREMYLSCRKYTRRREGIIPRTPPHGKEGILPPYPSYERDTRWVWLACSFGRRWGGVLLESNISSPIRQQFSSFSSSFRFRFRWAKGEVSGVGSVSIRPLRYVCWRDGMPYSYAAVYYTCLSSMIGKNCRRKWAQRNKNIIIRNIFFSFYIFP